MPNRRSTARRRPRHRRERRPRSQAGFLSRLVIMLAVVAAIVLGVAIFFQVNTVEVQGNVIYSQEQVRSVCGVEPGDNLLMVNRAAVVAKVRASMPYVQDASVGRILPDTVVIRIKESEVAALVKSDTGGDWYINVNGRVLGNTVEGFNGHIVTLTGFTLTAPKAGEDAAPAGERQENMDAALEVMRQLEGTGLMEQVTTIDVEKSYDILLTCGKRLDVMLGSIDQLDYKIQYLQVVMDGLEDYQTGTVDLTFDVEQVARFIPRVNTSDEEMDAETAEEEEERDEEADSEE